jgi:hypothetical protein
VADISAQAATISSAMTDFSVKDVRVIFCREVFGNVGAKAKPRLEYLIFEVILNVKTPFHAHSEWLYIAYESALSSNVHKF